jgi:hypothetical protein
VRVGNDRRHDPQDVGDWLKDNTNNPAQGSDEDGQRLQSAYGQSTQSGNSS